jgi:hypothetical protein
VEAAQRDCCCGWCWRHTAACHMSTLRSRTIATRWCAVHFPLTLRLCCETAVFLRLGTLARERSAGSPWAPPKSGACSRCVCGRRRPAASSRAPATRQPPPPHAASARVRPFAPGAQEVEVGLLGEVLECLMHHIIFHRAMAGKPVPLAPPRTPTAVTRALTMFALPFSAAELPARAPGGAQGQRDSRGDLLRALRRPRPQQAGASPPLPPDGTPPLLYTLRCAHP